MDLPIASVGATENIMIAASTAKGRTVLRNAAKEPEIVDLANYLRACGARIRGDGSTVMEMEGVPCLHGASHRVLPDRICAATYLSAVAVCGGCLRLQDAVPDDLVSVVPRFEEMGCRVSASGSRLDIQSDGILHAVRDVSTKEFPGFPTDAQPVLLASLTKSHGTTLFIENIFSNRYRYVEGLQKMGARVKVIDRVAVVEGVPSLYSADVEAPDLRGGAALIVAALAAEGVSTVQGSRYIDRGYEQIETVLTKVGAQIVRREENGAEQTQNVEAKETTDQKG